MNSEFYPKLLVFLQFATIGLMIFISHGLVNSLLGIFIFSIGAVIGLWALLHNKTGNFNIQPKLKDGCQLITTGAYHYIRHPMYTSVIFMMLGVLISSPSFLEFILFLLLIIVLLLKAKREEMLWCQHNKEYIEYQKETKFFLPYIL